VLQTNHGARRDCVFQARELRTRARARVVREPSQDVRQSGIMPKRVGVLILVAERDPEEGAWRTLLEVRKVD
jgi:hypothetical protein